MHEAKNMTKKPKIAVDIAKAAMKLIAIAALSGSLVGCSWLPSVSSPANWFGSDKPKALDLGPNPNLLAVRQAWTTRVGEVNFALQPWVEGGTVFAASTDGTVVAVEGASGRELWRASAGAALSAGVGSDGQVAAVVTTDRELVALTSAGVSWKRALPAQGFSAPFVAGGRVFVVTADRTVSAYDAANGAKLWDAKRPQDPLVLRQSSAMLAVGDTVLVGLGGRLVAFNPVNGTVRWEAAVSTSRGTNDVERLSDLIDRTSRVGDVVCARAFQSSVGCVNTSRGQTLWTKTADGAQGVHGDDRFVFGTEADGRVIAWKRTDGERAWAQEQLQHRRLSAPLSVGRSLALGDDSGQVHWLSREDGSLLARQSTDGSAIVAGPVLAGNTLIVVTQNGGIFGFQPEQ